MLSLIELQNKKVEAKRKKYEKDEMDEYLELIFNNYKQLLEENKKLETEKVELNKKIKTLSDGVQYYRSIETTLQKALILAEKTSKETKDAAILKGEAIERDAQKRADTLIQRAKDEYNQIREKSARLVAQFNDYKAQLRQAANAQLQLVDGEEFDLTEPIAENIGSTSSSSNIDDIEVEDIIPNTETKEAVTPTVEPISQSAVSNESPSASESAPIAATTEDTLKQAVSENVLERAETLIEESQTAPEFDTSKEELLNADTIDLSNTLEVVKTEAEEPAKENPTLDNSIVSPAMASVKDATFVEPIVATTIDATPVSVESPKEEVAPVPANTPQIPTNTTATTTEVTQPTLEEVLEEKKQASSTAAGGTIPTLDSLLQDLNMNNKGNQNSDDPFDFLGSIDDDF